MATHWRQQYFADEQTLQKESREFSIADEVQQKIDWIEDWAQVNIIEEIRVNWQTLIPDQDKAVDITVPDVIDSLSSTSITDALSAHQGKVLYDYIQNVGSRWRYLSNWDSATGLAVTNPEESPYEYKAWDYYSVSNVATWWGTNYRPDGTEYIIWQASTTVETEDVSVSDLYLYDGTTWLLLWNSGRTIAIDSSLSTTSTNPVENRVITNALNNKADAVDVNTKTFPLSWTWNSAAVLAEAQDIIDYFVAWNNPLINWNNCIWTLIDARTNQSPKSLWFKRLVPQFRSANQSHTDLLTDELKIEYTYPEEAARDVMHFNWNSYVGFLATDTNYPAVYIPQYDGSPATKKYVDDSISGITVPSYTAGTWIDITNYVISADTTTLATKSDLDDKQDKLTAGDNITIEDECYLNAKGPCQKGFHIGTQTEWRAMITTYNNLWLTWWGYWREYLHLPLTDDYDLNAYYWCANTYGSGTGNWSILTFSDIGINAGSWQPTYYAHPIRPIKDEPETPNRSWTTLYDWSSIALGAWIFWNAASGLISISSDGNNRITIADKNLWATTVYNIWDTRSQANCGNRFQWWNCYWFSWSWSTVDSTTPVDTTGYWPWNYYYSDVFIGTPSDWNWDWSSPGNRNLWWWDNPTWTWCIHNVISAQVPDSAQWWNITWTLSQQTDLQTALDWKVNLWNNKIFDSTVVEIGKWEHWQWLDSSGHHVTLDPNGELSTYNVTVAWHNDAILWSGTLTLINNTAIGWDETTVISQDGITITEWQNTKTYNFLWNDRIATLSDISWSTGWIVDDTAYGASWDWVATIAPSKNAVYDKISAMDTTISWKADATDINTKTFGGVRNAALWQEVYDWIKTAWHYAIVQVFNWSDHWQWNVAFSPTTVTTGNVDSWAYTHTDQSSAGVYYGELNHLRIAVSNWVVSSVSEGWEVIFNSWHVIVKRNAAPTGAIQWSMWYDTTTDTLKSYDWTNWNVVGDWDMNYSDFNWQSKTWATVTLDLASTITPESNFTINAPATIKDWQTYILRVNNWATAYTMTLGTNVTNPYQEDLTLTANGIDQFVFLAIGWNLELQPEAWAWIDTYVESVNWNSWAVTLKTINSSSLIGSGNISVQATLSNITSSVIKTWTSTTKYAVTAAALAWGLVRISNAANNLLSSGWKLWVWTQENYEALWTYDDTTVYLTV